jgi:hypothetical protein
MFILSLLSILKEKIGLETDHLPVCLSPLINFESIGIAYFHEIQQECQAIKDDLEAIIFNSAASSVLQWWTYKLLRWMQNQSAWDYNGLFGNHGNQTLIMWQLLLYTVRKVVELGLVLSKNSC